MTVSGIFDSHAHYFDRKFAEHPLGSAEEVLQSVFPTPVLKILNVGTNLQNSESAVEQAKKYNGMYAAVGIHPEDCHYTENPEEELQKLRERLSNPEKRKSDKIVALGEIGLDYHWERYGDKPMDKELEKFCFRRQLELSCELGLPVIIHDRDAHGDCFETVLEYPKARGVFHSYSGSAEMAKELVRRGWYLSFSGTLTFKNAPKVREAALAVPKDRLLVETDCPYLAPHPVRGSINHSGNLVYTLSALAGLWECSPQEAATVTAQNACRLFGIAD